ncbi:hypothetical protein Lser_V15G28721 [Lactuca serriola]
MLVCNTHNGEKRLIGDKRSISSSLFFNLVFNRQFYKTRQTCVIIWIVFDLDLDPVKSKSHIQKGSFHHFTLLNHVLVIDFHLENGPNATVAFNNINRLKNFSGGHLCELKGAVELPGFACRHLHFCLFR